MNQKKLIIFMPSIEGGGVEKNLMIIANYLATRVKNVALITISKKFKSKFSNKINFITTKTNFDYFNRKTKYLISLFLLFKQLLESKNKIVFSFQANIYCILLCKLLNVKVIVRSNSSPSGWSKNFVKKFIFRFVLSLADKIIVNSFDFKKEMKKNFNVKSSCIYNPLDVNKIKQLSKKKVESSNKKYLKIINIGRFTDQKDHMTLLKAAMFLKNKLKFKILILGRGINEIKIKNFIKSNKLEKIISIKKFTPNPYPYLKNSNLMILTSIYEGLPNVILEAITLNKFVISSNCPTGPAEILDGGKGGLLFKIKDYKDLARKIIFYTKNKKTCRKMLKHSKSRLIRFDYNTNLKKYFDLINSLCLKKD